MLHHTLDNALHDTLNDMPQILTFWSWMRNLTATQVVVPIGRAMWLSSNLGGGKNAFALWVEDSTFSTNAAILAGLVTMKVSNACGK
jgi:hypothetical protein